MSRLTVALSDTHYTTRSLIRNYRIISPEGDIYIVFVPRLRDQTEHLFISDVFKRKFSPRIIQKPLGLL